MTTHPFDSSRLLTPMVTGLLPASKPLIARGQVYCGNDFRQRAAAWFMSEQAGTKTTTAIKFTKTTTTKKTTTPTRVQPARAAKRKASPVEQAAPKKRLRVILTRASAVCKLAPASSHYSLSSFYATVTPAQFNAGLDMVLDAKKASLASGCHWSTSLMPSPAVSTTSFDSSLSTITRHSSWCPVVAEPLACIDRAYCLHAIGRHSLYKSTLTAMSTMAPEAPMTPPCTPPPIVLKAQAKGFAEMRHVQERTVEYGGLRFAVDVCDGSMRVWML